MLNKHFKSLKKKRTWWLVIVAIFTLLVWLFTHLGSFQIVCERLDFCKSYFETPQIILTISQKENLKVGDEFDIHYKVPPYGYMSLWNWNSQGNVKEILPATAMTAENNQKTYLSRAEASPEGIAGKEQLILLWSKNNPLKIVDRFFKTKSQFDNAVKALGNDIVIKEEFIQVNPAE